MDENKEKRYRRIIAVLCVVILLLTIGLIITGTRVRTIVVQTEQVNTQKEALKAELDSLIKEHDRLKSEYGHVSKTLIAKDSLIQASAKEIQEMMAYKYDYNKIKHKLDLLRNITQTYVRQMDSLLVVNKVLRKENVEIKENLGKEQEKVVGLNKKEDVTEKARRTDEVKVCFTLSENPVAPTGKRMIYIRIARPDNVIITQGTETETFMFNDQKIQFSMKKDIDYDGKAQNICLTWAKHDKKTDAMKGVYHVSVFCDNYEIGQGQFELK